MNKGIAHHLMLALSGLPGISRFGGLVTTQEQNNMIIDESGTERSVILRYPVTDDYHGTNNCVNGIRDGLADMSPSDTETGILYFEGNGTVARGRTGRYFSYESRLRLVIWLNAARICTTPSALPSPQETCFHDLPALLLNEVMKRLDNIRNHNLANYIRFRAEVSQVLDSSYNLFSPYSFDAKTTQYLMPPYYAMAADLNVAYELHQNCMQNLTVQPPTC